MRVWTWAILFCISNQVMAIAGGERVAEDSPIARQTVLLTVRSAHGLHGCSGSVLDDSHILTAAHCMIGANPGELVGVFATTYGDESRIREITFMQKVSESYIPDIAVFTYAGGLPPRQEFVTLARRAQLHRNDPVIEAGFGAIDPLGAGRGILRSVSVPILELQSEYIVAGQSGKAVCNGDSGGPQFVEVGGRLQQVGVHSSGDCSTSAASTIVANYIDWIFSTGARPQVD